MKSRLAFSVCLLMSLGLIPSVVSVLNSSPVSAKESSTCPALLNHNFRTLQGKPENLCAYQGKVLLVVNTASFCGYTSQYKDLQDLYQKYKAQGFVVMGFPANDFGKQEPGSDKEIAKFCKETYKVSFPMFSKSVVKGEALNPLFGQLQQKTGEAPLWNFHKYLIDRKGQQVLSFGSSTSPQDPKLIKALTGMLAQK
jgi:glutathione peroxidase